MDLTDFGRHEQVVIMTGSDLEQAFRSIVNEIISHWEEEKKKEEHWIPKAEALKRLGVDSTTLWRWNREGYLKAKHRGRKVFYLESDIEDMGAT